MASDPKKPAAETQQMNETSLRDTDAPLPGEQASVHEVAPPTKPEAQRALEADFARCRAMLADVTAGSAQMREGMESFELLWSHAIKNAALLYGRAATRAALIAMGRQEDVTKMY